MFGLFKKTKVNQNGILFAPVEGELIRPSEINDAVFSQQMMGPTVGFHPSDSTVFSPVNGTIEAVFPTGHAVGIRANSGEEWLIHVGIDTVSLNGKGFTTYIKQGQRIKAGDKLLEVDLDLLRSHHLDSTVMLILTSGVSRMNELPYGNVHKNQVLLTN